MAGAVDRIVVELRQFFEPLSLAFADQHEFAAFMRQFGFDLGGGDVGPALSRLAPVRPAVVQLAALVRQAVAGGLNPTDIGAVVTAARPLFDGMRTIGQAFSGVLPAGMSAQDFAQSLNSFPEELFDRLLTDYLTANAPIILHALAFLDVIRMEHVPATGDPASRGLTYFRPIYDWGRIGLVFNDAEAWARQAYGWGTDFDSDKFIFRLIRIVEYFADLARLDDMTEGQSAVFMPHLVGSAVPPRIAYAPLVKVDAFTPEGDPDLAASAEFGVALMPIAGDLDATRRSDGGLAVGPYADGTISQSIALSDTAHVTLTGNIGAVGGVIYSFRPSGSGLKTGIDEAALDGAFSAELRVSPPTGQQTIIFFGQQNDTRIEADAVAASLGGEASNAGSDFYVAGGVRNLKVVVDPHDDGLLSTLIPSPIEITAGDILVGWRSGRGVYFEGGSNLAIKVPLSLNLGPINIDALSLSLNWGQPPALTAAITGDITIGPFYAYADGIGVTATIVKDPDGILGDYDLRFGFKPPSAYALSLAAGPITGGGLLAVYDHEYRGALALNFETIGFSAFAILDTRLPDGQRGFSLAASIFGEFNLPLGYGFFLTGLGGVIGVNRTIDTNALRDVLFAGRLDNLLFPTDPIASAASILTDMAAILPPMQGQNLIGPAARIAFGEPLLIEIKLGVVVEVGAHVRLLVLGGVSSNLPTKDTALVSLNMPFFGEIDFAAGTISFDATLQGSRVLTWTVSGDAAFRTGWTARIDHVASIGGLHPSYPRPANLPDLRRLSINFGTNNPKITLTAYMAMTLDTLQFGARADLYAKGPHIWLVGNVAAEGHVYFDALIYRNPFGFDVGLGGSLMLLVDGDAAAGLGFDLRLRGPNTYRINGKVWVTVFGIDVDFHIDHTWGDEQSLPSATVDAAGLLRQAIERNPTLEPIAPTRRFTGISLASSRDNAGIIDPAGGARLLERVVPLGISISKVGEAQISGASLLDLNIFAGSTALVLASAEEDFVRGHFFDLSEAERLRAPEFDRFKAGFEISAEVLVVDEAKAIIEDYAYEVILIDLEDDRTRPAGLRAHPALTATFAARWVTVNDRRVGQPATGFRAGAARDAVTVGPSRFLRDTLAADILTNAARPRSDAIRIIESERSGFTDQVFRVAAHVPAEANRVVADYVAAAQL
jgi:hypothetical protein